MYGVYLALAIRRDGYNYDRASFWRVVSAFASLYVLFQVIVAFDCWFLLLYMVWVPVFPHLSDSFHSSPIAHVFYPPSGLSVVGLCG